MKNIVVNLILICIAVFIVSCRKDDSVTLPETNGNLLVMQFGSDYSFEGGTELTISDIFITDGILNIDLETKNCPPMAAETAVVSLSGDDTLIYFYNRVLDKPLLQKSGVFVLTDSNYSSSVSDLSTYSMSNPGDYNHNDLTSSLTNFGIVHAYLRKPSCSKIAVLKYITYEFDPELDATIPKIKFFTFIGHED